MRQSLDIGSYAGIPVKIHWSFGLIIIILGFIIYKEQYSFNESVVLCLYILSLFLCVVLHEYGHALAARKYGVDTKDIILSPIGGLARLDRIPEKPGQELWIAIAGPLVNLTIALLLFAIILFTGDLSMERGDSIQILLHPVGFMQMLLILNLVLFAFNLIPAFPMDGGRILRALLSYKLSRLRATYISSVIGRVISVAFVGIGIYYGHYALIFIGLFVYLMAFREYHYLRLMEMQRKMLLEQEQEQEPDEDKYSRHF